MSREKWLLRASVPFLTFSVLFAEGVPSALRWLGVVGVLVMTAAMWPRRWGEARKPKAAPEAAGRGQNEAIGSLATGGVPPNGPHPVRSVTTGLGKI